MSALQIVAIILGVGITIVGWGLLARAVKHFVTVFKLGASTPAKERTGQPGARTATLLREFLGHTRMSRLPIVAIAHWVTMVSFGVLFLTLVQATVQLFDPHFVLPLIGHFFLYEWITELFAMTGIITIVMLMVIRQKNHPRSAAGDEGRKSRFFGSTFWQAYYVELTILGVGICIALLRGLERALLLNTGEADHASLLHFPLTGWLGSLFEGMSVDALEAGIVVVALIKLLISYAWMITISINPTMGVAWHRFLAFFNIYFKRHADGRTSLGELQPMLVDGKPFSMEVMEEMEEDSTLGVGKVEDFTWKGLLDFSTCTECGRCQSQCPAWNTEKPLSPKLLMMTLRDHAHAKAPYLAAAQGVSGVYTPASAAKGQTADGAVAFGGAEAAQAEGAVATAEPDAINWGEMSLVGQTGYDIDHPLSAYNPHGPDAVIDEDVLWSCTTCGACVEQCPVDIEHVDHIVDMRRYQNLIESAFPSELGGLFKKLESKGNPWGMGAKARMDWAKDLPSPSRSSARTSSRPTTSTTSSGSAAPAPTRTAPRRRRARWPSSSTTLAWTSRSSATARPAPVTPPPRGQRGALPDARGAERRDAQRARRDQDRRHLRALLQHDQERVPAARRQVRGAAPHAAAQPPRPREEDRPGQPPRGQPQVQQQGRRVHRPVGDLPRPLLPGSAQQRLRPAA